MKVKAFLIEPAGYTLDRNRAVYVPMGIDWCYLRGDSEASDDQATDGGDMLAGMPFRKRLGYIRRALKENDAIIFNGYTGSDFLALYFLNLFYRKPVGIDSDTQYSLPASRLKRLVKRLYLGSVFRNRRYYGLAGGEYSHKDLFRKFGMPQARVMLMPMMVNNARFQIKDYDKKDLQCLRFLFIGRLIECKNLDILFEAFTAFQKSNINAELHIVGTGELENKLKERYANNANVFFDGPKFGEDLIATFKDCHILILPSSSEQWGLVVNEAMAAGLPVIVSDRVGARYDLVERRDTGFVFPFEDADALADCMTRIAQPETYRTFSRNAHALMHNHWNYDLYARCLRHFLSTAASTAKGKKTH